MSLFLLAASQLYPVPPARTPASLTIPRYEVACTLTGLHGPSRRTTFLQTGGRGYEDKRPEHVGNSVQRTDISLEVVRDETGIFAGYEFMGRALSDEQARWRGVRRFQNGPKTIQIESFFTKDPRQIAIVVEPDWPDGAVAVIGLCDLKAMQQQPLTAVETRKWLDR